MKQFARIAMIALVFGVALPASAGGYYVDVFVGPSKTDDTAFGVLGTSEIETDFDSGMNMGVSFGYTFDNAWRVEGELMNREGDVDTHDLDMGGAIAGSSGEAKATSIFANVFYDFETSTRVTPYVGAGLGNVNVDYINFAVPGLDAMDDDDSVIGYQIVAGLAVKINDRWDFRTDFRLFEAQGADLTSSVATGSTMSDVDYSSVDMTAGVRIRF
ncbi:MAG: porin family protein [Acidobacteriota bacterium]|nr:porin family protein [Acidobacteriota bacterium]MDH3786340.1 porin family protein [Acidobacteriota bacterium]